MNTISTFVESHATALQGFLSAPQRPSGTFAYPQCAGFLFAIANGPELILPSEWMPMVFNDAHAGYETTEEAERIMETMMALYNDCARERPDGLLSLPPGCEIRLRSLDNLDHDAPLSQWAQGFGIGHDYLEEVWDAYTPDELDEDLGSALMALTFFASPKLAKAYHQEGNGKRSLEELAETIVEIFPDAMREYAHVGRAIYRARHEANTLDPSPVTRSKIGRNDPCLCGSGKKFKRCCGKT